MPVPVGNRTGFFGRMNRFGFGIGVMSVSRGYGPINDQPIAPEPPTRVREGGPGPSIRASRKREPKVLGIRKKRPAKKTRCKAAKKKLGAKKLKAA